MCTNDIRSGQRTISEAVSIGPGRATTRASGEDDATAITWNAQANPHSKREQAPARSPRLDDPFPAELKHWHQTWLVGMVCENQCEWAATLRPEPKAPM